MYESRGSYYIGNLKVLNIHTHAWFRVWFLVTVIRFVRFLLFPPYFNRDNKYFHENFIRYRSTFGSIVSLELIRWLFCLVKFYLNRCEGILLLSSFDSWRLNCHVNFESYVFVNEYKLSQIGFLLFQIVRLIVLIEFVKLYALDCDKVIDHRWEYENLISDWWQCLCSVVLFVLE